MTEPLQKCHCEVAHLAQGLLSCHPLTTHQRGFHPLCRTVLQHHPSTLHSDYTLALASVAKSHPLADP